MSIKQIQDVKRHPVLQCLPWLAPTKVAQAFHSSQRFIFVLKLTVMSKWALPRRRSLISVIVIAIVTNASSTNCVSQCCSDFAVSLSQAHLITPLLPPQPPPPTTIINRSSLWPYLPSDTGCSLHSPNCLQSRFNKLSTDALLSMWNTFLADAPIRKMTSIILALFTVTGPKHLPLECLSLISLKSSHILCLAPNRGPTLNSTVSNLCMCLKQLMDRYTVFVIVHFHFMVKW